MMGTLCKNDIFKVGMCMEMKEKDLFIEVESRGITEEPRMSVPAPVSDAGVSFHTEESRIESGKCVSVKAEEPSFSIVPGCETLLYKLYIVVRRIFERVCRVFVRKYREYSRYLRGIVPETKPVFLLL